MVVVSHSLYFDYLINFTVIFTVGENGLTKSITSDATNAFAEHRARSTVVLR